MTKKTIDTLVEDIYHLFDVGHEVDPDNCQKFGELLSSTIAERLKEYSSQRDSYLRLSSIGKPDRQVYYEVNNYPKESLTANTKVKFLFGDILECLLLFLAREAGHEVTEEQKPVIIEGVKGHKDCRIDGVTVDVKSASTRSFDKFRSGKLLQEGEDPFGYKYQLASYVQGDEEEGEPEDGAFLAIDKQLGHITLLTLPALEQPNVRNRTRELKELVEKPEPPERCYEPVPEGKSGNMKLSVGCAYCPFKKECWKDANNNQGLRSFAYSSGVVHFTHIEKEPKVPEIKGD